MRPVHSARWIRGPVVAGSFYPADPAELRRLIGSDLAEARQRLEPDQSPPKALIAPHAGYVYSGPIAASAYAALGSAAGSIRRVVLLGPSHRVRFAGLAAPTADAFATPLGLVPLDGPAIEAALRLPAVRLLDEAHAAEHSLEVQLPFLQVVLAEFRLAPLAVGEADAAEIGGVLDLLWGGPETLIVVSSDLSHYHDYAAARRLDRATSDAIEGLAGDRIGPEQACGCLPIRGLLEVVSRRGLRVRTVDLRNSGDTAGPRDRVVGYGAYLCC